LAQAVFEPDLLPYKYPNNLAPVIIHYYPPMKMELKGCSKMLADKLQTLANHPEQSI
jgi:hypothetical protein